MKPIVIFYTLTLILSLALSFVVIANAQVVNYPLVNNPGFETSCPQTQDLLTCGWSINTQDCTFLSTCSIVTSANAPEKSNYFHAVGLVGQGQQNNDILGNTTTSNPSSTPILEFFVRWNGITSCQGVGHSCLFKLAFVFNANSKIVNYYWANNFTIFSSTYVNSSSAVYYPISTVCGPLTVSATFCHFVDSNFMTRAQAYFSNTLTSYGFGQGSASFANHPIFYGIDMSFGCFVISPAVCGAANWNVDADYIAVGALNSPFQTSVNNGAQGFTFFLAILMFGVVLIVSSNSDKRFDDIKERILPAAIIGAIILLALAATGL